jgi:aryl-alcohol dehydrogenase-like predicted oxidoreductase
LAEIVADERVDVIQAPFSIARRDMESGMRAFKQRGGFVIAREVLKAPPDIGRVGAGLPVKEALRFAVSHDATSVSLIGTTNVLHLKEAVEALRSI